MGNRLIMIQFCSKCFHQEYDKEYRIVEKPICKECVVSGHYDEKRSNWIPKDFLVYCEIRYGNMFHSVREYKDPFEKGKSCYCCHNEAVTRIDANVWGTVCQFDVCQKHADMYDGKNVESVDIEAD